MPIAPSLLPPFAELAGTRLVWSPVWEMFTSSVMDAIVLCDSSLSSHLKAGRNIIVCQAAVQTKRQRVTPNLWHSFSVLPFSVHFLNVLPPLSPFLSWSTTPLILTLPWLETASFPLSPREPAGCPGHLGLARHKETDRGQEEGILKANASVLFSLSLISNVPVKTAPSYTSVTYNGQSLPLVLISCELWGLGSFG